MTRLIGIAALLLSIASAAAADTKVTGSLDRPSVRVGESALLTIQVAGGGSGITPRLDAPDGLRIREAGQSRNYSLINGKFTQSIQLQYSVTGLRPGRYEVGPVEVEVSGRAYQIGPFPLTVRAEGTSEPGTPENRSTDRSTSTPPLIVEMEIEPNEVFVGQQVLQTVRFLQRGDLSVYDARFIPPETEGFWKVELPPERRTRVGRAGTLYEGTEILAALFPTRTGELPVSPARVQARYREPDRRRDRFFPFSLGGREREAELASESKTIRVLPLPKPVPDRFTGAVGRFTLSSRFDREDAVQGEPLTWTIDVTGTGNVTSLEIPPFPEIPGCRGFDAGTEVETSRTNDRVGGRKSFSHVLIPESAGTIDLPAIRWVFFDPAAGEYVESDLPSRTLQVTPASGSAGQEGGRIGGAIRSIRAESNLSPLAAARPWVDPRFWVVQAIPLAALGFGLFRKQRRDRAERDPAGARLRAAPRKLRAALRSVQEETSDPWGRLHRAVESFLADRYGNAVRGMTWERLREHLVSQGTDPAAAEDLARTLSEIEARRYRSTSGAERTDLAEVVRSVGDLTARLGGR